MQLMYQQLHHELCSLQVYSLIKEHDLDLTEEEYALLVGVCAHGVPWGQARAVLDSMSQELTALQEGTLAAMERYFRSGIPAQTCKRAACMLRRWRPELCTPALLRTKLAE